MNHADAVGYECAQAAATPGEVRNSASSGASVGDARRGAQVAFADISRSDFG